MPAGAVAIVGSEPILRSQYDFFWSRAKLEYAQKKQAFPAIGSTDYQKLRDSVVTYLVQQAAFRYEANQMGVKVTNAEIQSSLAQNIANSFGGSRAKFEAALRKDHLTEAQVMDQIRMNLLQQRVSTELAASVNVSSGEIKDYYNAHKSSYQVGESRTASHILLKTKAKAEDVYRQLKAGANFAALAKKYSIDKTTKVSGGSFSTPLEEKGLVKPFANVLFGKLKTGSFSQPVKTIYGWHIILATGPIVKAHLQSLSEASATIKQTLLTPKQNDAVTNWVKKAQKYATDNTNYAPGFKPTTTSPSTVATTTTS